MRTYTRRIYLSKEPNNQKIKKFYRWLSKLPPSSFMELLALEFPSKLNVLHCSIDIRLDIDRYPSLQKQNSINYTIAISIKKKKKNTVPKHRLSLDLLVWWTNLSEIYNKHQTVLWFFLLTLIESAVADIFVLFFY